ncbi:MAG: hypothetical protein Q8M67_00130 [Bacteroidota bacterium]|nr:hypothetical protein [Bacteroidota bacterium]
MIKGCFLLVTLNLPQIVSRLAEAFEKETLVWIILIMAIPFIAVVAIFIFRITRNIKPIKLSRFLKIVKLEILLEKDKPLRPQLLTLTIRNTGKNEADIDAPVLEFRKIWTKRKFKLSGINGNAIYPLFIDSGKSHQLRIETSTFHQYDRSIKSFYWARVIVTDVDGRQWKSNSVKLRKSLVT